MKQDKAIRMEYERFKYMDRDILQLPHYWMDSLCMML